MYGESLERYFRVIRGPMEHSASWDAVGGARPDVYRTHDERDGEGRPGPGIQPADVEIRLSGPLLHSTGLRRDSFCGEGHFALPARNHLQPGLKRQSFVPQLDRESITSCATIATAC